MQRFFVYSFVFIYFYFETLHINIEKIYCMFIIYVYFEILLYLIIKKNIDMFYQQRLEIYDDLYIVFTFELSRHTTNVRYMLIFDISKL